MDHQVRKTKGGRIWRPERCAQALMWRPFLPRISGSGLLALKRAGSGNDQTSQICKIRMTCVFAVRKSAGFQGICRIGDLLKSFVKPKWPFETRGKQALELIDKVFAVPTTYHAKNDVMKMEKVGVPKLRVRDRQSTRVPNN